MENDLALAITQPGLKIPDRSEKPGKDYQPGQGLSARANGLKSLKKSHVIKTEFQPRLKSELGRAFSAPFCYSGNSSPAISYLALRLTFQPGLKFVI